MAVCGKKALCGTLVVWLLLSLCGLALAGCPGQQENMPKPDPQEMERHIGEKLAKLVDAGTITKDQSDKVIQHWREKDQERQADMAKMKDMTPDERQAYMDQKRKDKPDIVADLVTTVGLTEEQAQAVAAALRPPGPPPHNPR